MKVGKLTASDLKSLIFDNIKGNRKEILTNPKIGGDCAVVDFGEKVAHISTDPITGTSDELGKLAVNINCNDIATAGVAPIGLMLTILAPEGTSRKEIRKVMKDAQNECDKLGVSIIGGHTEITKAVNQMIASVTAIGIGDKKEYKEKEKAIPGDLLILTKGVGIEGTGIIAFEKEKELTLKLGKEIVESGKAMLDKTSVVKEGLIANPYTKGMHDVTEGGILGAIWEMTEFYELGVEIEKDKLKVADSTKAICEYYNIDPLKLISSGSMLLVASKEKSIELIAKLKKENIELEVIGKLTENLDKIMISNNEKQEIPEPESDELYKVV